MIMNHIFYIKPWKSGAYFTCTTHLSLDWPHVKWSAPPGASGGCIVGAALGAWQGPLLIENVYKVLQEHLV